MKRKIILVSVILVLALTCFAACNGYDSQLNTISALLKSDYSVVEIFVTTNTSGIELNGEYTLTFGEDSTTVKYTYEELNALDTNGNNNASFKSTRSGYVVVNENNVIVDGDDSIDLNMQLLDFTGLSFKQAFFSNVTATKTSFVADVANPQGFVGNKDFSCSDMRVKALFKQDSLTRIEISYVSSANSNVNISYWFTK